MIDAVDAPLHHGKDALNAVRGAVAAPIFARAVVDRFMRVEQPADAPITARLVGVDGRAVLNVAVHEAVDRAGAGVGNDNGAGAPATLASRQNRRLTDRATAMAPGGAKEEAEYHRRFAGWRQGGEWFTKSPEIIEEMRRLREAHRDEFGFL
jgi:hypothetical protein